MKKWLIGGLALAALAAVGLLLWGRFRPGARVDWSRSPDQVVFQMDTFGGLIHPFSAATHLPELTVYGDGRALFLRDGKDVHEAKLPAQQLGSLLVRAHRDLSGLKSQYPGTPVPDGSNTWFTLAVNGERRTVEVHMLGLNRDETRPERDVRRKLLALQKAFRDALPADAPPHMPERISLATMPLQPGSYSGQVRAWPANLPPLQIPPLDTAPWYGQVTVEGEAARQVLREVRSWPSGVYETGGQPARVTALPIIPILHRQ